MRRLDEEGPDALVRLPAPVNRFPDFVTLVVKQLRAVCPLLGKVRIAQMLARAGLVLSASTVKRMLERTVPRPRPPADPEPRAPEEARETSLSAGRVVFARYPGHVWHIDLTVVPTALGFWVPWLPFALAQRWPFGAWIAVVLDHFTRSAVASGVFTKEPTAPEVLSVLDRGVAAALIFRSSSSGERPDIFGSVIARRAALPCEGDRVLVLRGGPRSMPVHRTASEEREPAFPPFLV